MATAPKLDEMLAPDPPEEPPTVLAGSYGFLVEPNNEPWVSPRPISPRVDLPMITAPAFLNCSVTKESLSG